VGGRSPSRIQNKRAYLIVKPLVVSIANVLTLIGEPR
jgi:hypothetical protein